MTYKLIASWALIVLLLGLLNQIAQTADNPDASDQGISLLNAGFGVEEVSLDEPTVGDTNQGGVLGTGFSIVKQATGFVTALANALFFNYSFFTGDLAFIRYVLLAFSMPVMVMMAIEGQRLLGGMIRGLFGRVA